MDFNYILFWIVLISCVSVIYRAWRHGSSYRRWSRLSALVLVLMLCVGFMFPSWDGVGGAILWLSLVLAPMLVYRRFQGAMFRFEFDRAARLARILAVLFPFGDERRLPQLVTGHARARAGETTAAQQVFDQLIAGGGAIGSNALVQKTLLTGDWSGFRHWLEAGTWQSTLNSERQLIPIYLRALGETGDLNRLVQAYRAVVPPLESSGDRHTLALARLMLFAFCGMGSSLRQLFAGPLRVYPREVEEFWRATAAQVAGQYDEAGSRLGWLASHGTPSTKVAVIRRQASALADPRTALDTAALETLAEAERECFAERAVQRELFASSGSPQITRWLIAINVGVFLAQSVGVVDLARSFMYGALVPQAVWLGGQYWRIFSAMFLHAGIAHLLMNTLALNILGPPVERVLGRVRFLLVYLLCGAGSMSVIVLLNAWGLNENRMVVGASGAIMGLVGATGAIYFVLWRRFRAQLAYRQLGGVLTIVGIQAVFDLLTPQVSFTAHASGAVIGGLATLVLFRRLQTQQQLSGGLQS